MGDSVEVIKSSQGLSRRGTADDQLLSGDVVWKRLVTMATQVDLSPRARVPPPEPRVRVKVRERASRRALTQAVDTAEAEARAHQVAAPLVECYTQHVGLSMVQYARLGPGRRIHILDTALITISATWCQFV